MSASPKPVSPETVPASSAESRATSSAALNKSAPRELSSQGLRLAEDAGVEPFLGLHLRREVTHPRLLVLAGRVEGEPLGDARLLGHGVQDVLALLDAAAVDHAEDGVRPVLVGGALVAMGDRLVVGEGVADLVYTLFRHLPDAHRVRPEARLAVVEDGREAAHDLAPLQVVGTIQQPFVREPDLPAPQVEGPRRQGGVLLQGPDGGFVVLRNVPVGALPVDLAVLRGLLLRGGALLHVERDADLEELERGQDPGLLGAAYAVEDVHGAFESQPGIGGHRHRVPEVERIVSLVVVGDAGVGVYRFGTLGEPFGWYLRGHEARLVAEDAGVEDRADLADHPSSFQRLYPADYLVPGDPHLAPDRRKRLPLQRELPLDQVEYVLV